MYISDKDEIISYPQNVTLSNLAAFIITSTNLTYTLNGVKRKPRDFKKASKLICYSIIAHYLCAFLLHQFIIPDVELASQYLFRRNIFSLIAVTFKLVVRLFIPSQKNFALNFTFQIPIFILWLIYFYFYCFKCYMGLFGCVWGTEDANLMDDWWNAETTTIYWSKWNVQVHTSFKNCIFVPLLKMGYTKLQASLAVSLLSGVLHEYLVRLDNCILTSRLTFFTGGSSMQNRVWHCYIWHAHSNTVRFYINLYVQEI